MLSLEALARAVGDRLLIALQAAFAAASNSGCRRHLSGQPLLSGASEEGGWCGGRFARRRSSDE
jgi:hypothetical protein